MSDLLFFFFKQKTAYEMRISDWSSDVCSSDLSACDGVRDGAHRRIVTSLGADGRSCILFDDAGGAVTEGGDTRVTLLWQSDASPADNSGQADLARASYLPSPRGDTKFQLLDCAADATHDGPGTTSQDPHDYGILMTGSDRKSCE